VQHCEMSLRGPGVGEPADDLGNTLDQRDWGRCYQPAA
jgi:hypothetical protein